MRSAFGRRAGRSVATTEERGVAKWRGRGLGQRNIKSLDKSKTHSICINVNPFFMSFLSVIQNTPFGSASTLAMISAYLLLSFFAICLLSKDRWFNTVVMVYSSVVVLAIIISMLVAFFTTGHSVLFTPWTLRILVLMSILLIVCAFIAQPSAREMSMKIVEQGMKNRSTNDIIGYKKVDKVINDVKNTTDAVEAMKNEIKNFSVDKIDPIYYGGRVEDKDKIENINAEVKETVKEAVKEELKKEPASAVFITPVEKKEEVHVEKKKEEHVAEQKAVDALAENIKQEKQNIEKITELANVATKQVELQTNLTEKVNTIEATVKQQNEVMSKSIKDLQNEVQVIGGAVQGLIERMTQMFSFLTTVLQGNTPNNSEKPAGAM